ncbi:hypothetical protein B0I35DRAFT_423885 [Stachybotrys elegans]|uniref:Uncharacterized protein n=1 Tax=Stachybotrys elegans TaxID=80388 RepID=A0A8K0ST37_9HYPO|nr:hypothetical protein B0I35DRAFT_423885 [Stachybotrys elegans]
MGKFGPRYRFLRGSHFSCTKLKLTSGSAPETGQGESGPALLDNVAWLASENISMACLL